MVIKTRTRWCCFMTNQWKAWAFKLPPQIYISFCVFFCFVFFCFFLLFSYFRFLFLLKILRSENHFRWVLLVLLYHLRRSEYHLTSLVLPVIVRIVSCTSPDRPPTRSTLTGGIIVLNFTGISYQPRGPMGQVCGRWKTQRSIGKSYIRRER